jgi:hypothetical protein
VPSAHLERQVREPAAEESAGSFLAQAAPDGERIDLRMSARSRLVQAGLAMVFTLMFTALLHSGPGASSPLAQAANYMYKAFVPGLASCGNGN